MTEVGIFVGTMHGNALSVAEKILTILGALNYQADMYENSELADWTKYQNNQSGCVLIITSTTGQGDLPENIELLFQEIKAKISYQPNLRYSIIALGDSSYTNFCGAGKKFDALLQQQGARRIGEILFIDAAEYSESENKLNSWLKHWITLLK